MIDPKVCSVCQRIRPLKGCRIILLTPAEEAGLIAIGVTPDAEYVYCLPCWRVLIEPSSGPNLMRGSIERQLLRLGMQPKRAKMLADKYHTRLIEMQRRSKHSTQS